MLLSRTPVETAWLDAELEELARLVDNGETLEAVGVLSRIVREPRRAYAHEARPEPERAESV
jgi:hypothetical protein